MVEYSGAYFKHTNFEKAVIATNGKAPYNNKEVELITQPEGFDPNGYRFKNNWVNNMIRSGKKSPPPEEEDAHAHEAVEFNPPRTADQLSGIPSASVTATTVFEGYNPHEDGGNPVGGNVGSQPLERTATPAGSFHALQNNLVSDSPVTMMNMSYDKGRIGTAGDTLIHGHSGSNFQQHSIHAGTEVFKGGSVLAQTEELDDHAIVITEKARNRAGKPK